MHANRKINCDGCVTSSGPPAMTRAHRPADVSASSPLISRTNDIYLFIARQVQLQWHYI